MLHFVRDSLLLLEAKCVALMELLLAALKTGALVLLHQAVSGAEVAIAVLAIADSSEGHRIAFTERAASSFLGSAHLQRAALRYEDEGLLAGFRKRAQNAIVVHFLAVEG